MGLMNSPALRGSHAGLEASAWGGLRSSFSTLFPSGLSEADEHSGSTKLPTKLPTKEGRTAYRKCSKVSCLHRISPSQIAVQSGLNGRVHPNRGRPGPMIAFAWQLARGVDAQFAAAGDLAGGVVQHVG